jgi:hypothetical protein
MAATRNDILTWLTSPRYLKALGTPNSRYCLIICDTFDWEDYPVYVDTAEQAVEHVKNLQSMEKLMEVYDLKGDIDKQMNLKRCYAIDVPGFKKNV